jgi:alcohol dehydrogenase (cytochrome c)
VDPGRVRSGHASLHYGTGNPTPSYTQGRGEGDNLYTSALLAVNVDTGKMAWYFQTSPHDTHDWDSTQTPILTDAMFGGRMRKLVITATRNGYFFVLDRVTGEHLVTSKLGLPGVNNWASGLDAKGQPKRNPNKDATIAGSLVNSDVLNYRRPRSRRTPGLFYVHEQNSLRISYLMEPDPRGSMGLGGTSAARTSPGHEHRRHRLQDGQDHVAQGTQRRQRGLLPTAGGVLFLSNGRTSKPGTRRPARALVLADRRPRRPPRRSCSTANSTCCSARAAGCTCSS